MAARVIVALHGSTLLAFDQHAAHERVRVEALQAALKRAHAARAAGGSAPVAAEHPCGSRAALLGGGVAAWGGGADGAPLASKALLAPPCETVALADSLALQRYGGAVRSWGWEVCAGRGAHEWTCTHVPLVFGRALTAADLRAYLAELRGGASEPGSAAARVPQAALHALRSVSCRGAVMFGDALRPASMHALLACLARTEMPFHCAHGRPTAAPLLDLVALDRLVGALRQGRAALDEVASEMGGACDVAAPPMGGRLRSVLDRAKLARDV